MISIVYLTLACVATYEFGANLTGSVLDVVGQQRHMSSSYIIRSGYLIGLVCHIPFLFFAGKESFLTLIAESWNKSLSTSIENGLKEHEKKHLNQTGSPPSGASLNPDPEVENDVQRKSVIESMDPYTYFIGTSILIGVCVLGAITIPDPEQIFEIISGFTVSAIVFIFPALFYLVA